MNFGQDKCAHLFTEKRQIKINGQHLEMNGVKIQQVDEGECDKYLGQDESISYTGTVNKERVSKEYFTRVRKIWKSKLSGFNKTIAHDMFAVPVLKAIQIAYACGIVSLNHHLTRNKDRNQLLSIVCQSEERESGRVAGELCCKYDITVSKKELPRSVGQKYLRSKYKEFIENI